MVTRKAAELKRLKAFVDTVRIKSADLKNKILFLEFCGFPYFLDVGKGRILSYVA